MLREMRVHPRDTGQAAPSTSISCLQDTDNLLLHEEAKLKRKKVHPANKKKKKLKKHLKIRPFAGPI